MTVLLLNRVSRLGRWASDPVQVGARVDAGGYHTGVAVVGSFRSVQDAAVLARQMLGEGEPLEQVWRFAIIQMFDDYCSMLRHDGVEAAAALWTPEPTPTGDSRVDAAFAALAEHLARRDGWVVPGWARAPEREALPWWFVTNLRGLHPRALVESPASFRRRGVFITTDALERV